jgi:hypothetical protein
MDYEWVIGVYDGERAKQVQGLADSGIGYYKVDGVETASGKKTAVAFRRALDGLRPEHLLEVKDPHKLARLEKQYADRTGATIRG